MPFRERCAGCAAAVPGVLRGNRAGLKYLITNPGRYSVPEAFYMVRQGMTAQIAGWKDTLTVAPFDYDADYFKIGPAELICMTGGQELSDEELFFWFGFWHDRDVLVYYGDPKWNFGMQEVPGETDFTVTSEFKRLSRTEAEAAGASRRCVITVVTSPDFSLLRMQGDGFQEEHVLDLPLLYNPAFGPGRTYTFEVLCD